MKFTASRSALIEAFANAGSIVASRTIKPILSNFHLVSQGDGMAEVRSTDLDISIRFRLPLESHDGAGELVIPAQRTSAIIKECATESITFESDDSGKVKIRSGRASFQILCENPAEFPTLPVFNEEAAFGLERSKLQALMAKTQFAVAKEKSRFAFNGAKLDIEGDVARMIATDGRRLAMMTVKIDNADQVTASPIVPARALSLFEKVLTDADDVIRVALDERQVMIKTARAELAARLVEGQFPNYKAVIPTETPIRVEFDREELLRAFRQSSLLTSQETRSVRLRLQSGRATLTSQALDAGEATIELDAPDFGSDTEFAISFNPDFVADGLRVMESERVTICLSRPNHQAKITGDTDFVYVIMPVTMRSA